MNTIVNMNGKLTVVKYDKDLIDKLQRNRNDLSELEIEYVDLSLLNLTGLNSNKSNFINCVFNNSNLAYSDFKSNDLSYTSFANANLTRCTFEDTIVDHTQFPLFSKHNITYYSNTYNEAKFEDMNLSDIVIMIGCKHKTIKEWDYFFSNECSEEYETKRDTKEFKRIKAHYKAFKIYLEEIYS